MQFSCSRAALTQAVTVVAGAVPTRTTRDVLKNFRLQVRDGLATLSATDGEIGIRYELPIDATTGGDALLPTARVLSILRELGEDAVRLELTGDAVWIRNSQSEFRLPASDPAEFPPVPQFTDAAYYSLPAGILKLLIKRTLFAADVESTRYALGGVAFELSEEKLTLAATDTRRLAVVSGPCKLTGTPAAPPGLAVVPAKAVSLIDRSMGDVDQEVHIAMHSGDVVVKTGPATISGLLVQGRFPDYRRVIPTNFTGEIDLVTGPFYSAVRQSQIVTNEESRGVDFQFTSTTMRLVSEAADVGESKIELPISYGGEEVKIMFDPRYIAEFLRVLEPGTPVRLQLIDSTSAVMLTTADGYLYVIMPLSRDRAGQ